MTVANSLPRILIVDDEQSILEAYRQVLSGSRTQTTSQPRLDALENRLFPDSQQKFVMPTFDLCLCRQGHEAVEAVRTSITEKSPFSVAFIDVRMPPGKDGVWAASEIRKLDPWVNIVIVTAFSDLNPAEINHTVQPPNRLLYMQKPFHSHEIQQFALALSAKWQAEQELTATNQHLDTLVQERTKELNLTIEALELSNLKYRETTQQLKKTEAALAEKAEDLTGTNQALQELMRKNDEDQREVEQKVMFTAHEMIEPYLDKLEKSPLDDYQQSFLKIIRTNLSEIVAPFMKDLAHKYFRLSPTELNIANLIRQGISTKDISDQLKMTKRNVDFHRDRIREKIGIKNTKANLRAVLQDLEYELSDH
ncbi:MAG: LuxR C-terminal-related transcriptional regulator [Proteobacteria bacterium]|nr:response regulator [Desulfobulbaceae bacterium]MBU4153032.1 LuxR C-terminal-related transcriptional regulator [Pseudomonadota bacterium]